MLLTKKLNSNMCTMCIEYHFALLGKTAKGLFFSISLCIRWMARKRKRGFFFLMGKLFIGNSFLTRVYMHEEHFLGFIFNEEAPSFGLSNTLDFGSLMETETKTRSLESHLKSWPYCIVSDSLLFVNILCLFLCLTFACVLHNTTTHNLYFHTEYQLKCLVNVVELTCVATSSRWVVNFARGR